MERKINMKWEKRINAPAQQPPNEEFAKLASDEAVQRTAQALKDNGIETFIVESGEEAKKKITELLPEDAEVFTSTSRTLDTLGIPTIVNEKYDSVRVKLSKMDPKTQQREMIKMGAVPEYMIGSVHAVTEGGSVVIASNTGSQLAGYAASASYVIWVIGTQKIVSDMDEAIKRVYEYVYPLEDIRAQDAYGIHSNVSKLLIVNKEINPNRTKVIFVKEKLGY
jgi:L-lactate utilization protein LutC